MSDILLAKPSLPEGFIDTSVGEPYLVKESLSKFIDLDNISCFVDKNVWEYPRPNGYKPLIDLLEEKHQATVIITNGAKQALGATFYALTKMGYENVKMKNPFWALIPPLSKYHNLTSIFGEPDSIPYSPYLLLAPNNPDGHCQSLDSLKETYSVYKNNGIPFIHDAAYFTHTYLPPSYELGSVGDVQIFSASKMYGLSGLRIGYAVCYNSQFTKLIQEYMEMMTVGVSNISQKLFYNLLTWQNSDNDLHKNFINDSYESLIKAKLLVKQIKKEILEVPDNLVDIPGMFGWFKVGPKADFNKAKVNFIDGALFGQPGYVRMNLALPENKLREVIFRLNNLI